MTAEQLICGLAEKYGEEFNWRIILQGNDFFVDRLKTEISGNPEFFAAKIVRAISKCDSDDGVLYCFSEDGAEVFYIFHLTYSQHIAEGFPKYVKFCTAEDAAEYIENKFVAEFL